MAWYGDLNGRLFQVHLTITGEHGGSSFVKIYDQDMRSLYRQKHKVTLEMPLRVDQHSLNTLLRRCVVSCLPYIKWDDIRKRFQLRCESADQMETKNHEPATKSRISTSFRSTPPSELMPSPELTEEELRRFEKIKGIVLSEDATDDEINKLRRLVQRLRTDARIVAEFFGDANLILVD